MTSRQPAISLASLLLLATLLLTAFRAPGAAPAQPRRSVASALEAYAQAMRTGDYSRVRFRGDVTFEGPLTDGAIVGEAPVKKFLLGVSRDVRDVRVKRQIIDGEFACVVAELETKSGVVVPFCEFFRVVDGEVAQIRPFFDPRPLLR